jgi:hypothetical protein
MGKLQRQNRDSGHFEPAIPFERPQIDPRDSPAFDFS